MQSYLIMMSTRLLEMERILKDTGKYLSTLRPRPLRHYLKLVMDAVFGRDNFQNEVVWKRTSAHNDPGRFGRIHDTLFYYVKGEECDMEYSNMKNMIQSYIKKTVPL